MKRPILIFACAAFAFLFANSAIAFPGERIPYRAAHFASKVVTKVDNHVIHPVTHGIARRVR